MEKRNFTFNNHFYTLQLADEVDDSIFTEIFKLREYRRAEERIKNAEFAIVDVGAHKGFFSLYARALNPSAPIFALEPEPHNLAALEETIKINRLTNITIIPKALYNQTGRANLMLTSDSHNHFLERPFKNDGEKIRVATLSFDDFRKTQRLSTISVLKMDVEGGEYAIFENLSLEDFSSIENLIIEYHNTKLKTYKIIESLLREHGFSVEIFPSKFEKTMGFLFAQNKRK